MKIAGMVVWVLTAGIGIYLLAAGIAAQRQAGTAALASITAPAGGAVPGGGRGTEGSPLLEFMHPLLALTGLTFWIFFTMTGDRLFAWIAFGVVVATVLAGLTWAVATRRVAGRAGAGAAGFPAHLLMIHGLAAACTVTLVVISAITAAHG